MNKKNKLQLRGSISVCAMALMLSSCANPAKEEIISYRNFLSQQADKELEVTDLLLRAIQLRLPEGHHEPAKELKLYQEQLLPKRLKLCESYRAYKAENPDLQKVNLGFIKYCEFEKESLKFKIESLQNKNPKLASQASMHNNMAIMQRDRTLADLDVLYEKHGL